MVIEYIVGMILFGVVFCIVMVFVWSYLIKGDVNYILVQVLINDFIMVIVFVLFIVMLLGVIDIMVFWDMLFFLVVFYVVFFFVVGYIICCSLEKKKVIMLG